jgi:hypothetical protein
MRERTDLRTFALALAALPVILFASCADDKKEDPSTPVEVLTVTLSPAEVVELTGKTITLNATIAPENATDKTLKWSSSNAAIAEVDAKGLVITKAPGTATLTATASNGKKGTATVQVFDPSDIPIADAAFKTWLLSNITHAQPDKISLEEAKAVETISYTEQKQIKSLKGIEFFENLKVLECTFSSLTKLDVSRLTNLTYLDCNYNESLTELTLGNLPKLRHLNCQSTSIAKLDVSGFTELNSLHCRDNKSLTELILGNLPKLEDLASGNTSLTKLDVSDLTELSYLECRGNESLIELTLGSLSKLEHLYCNGCNLTRLDASCFTELKYLYCNDNESLTELTLGSSPRLSELNCHNTKLAKLDVSGLTGLRELTCDENKSLKDVWFKNIEQKDAILRISMDPGVTVHYYE